MCVVCVSYVCSMCAFPSNDGVSCGRWLNKNSGDMKQSNRETQQDTALDDWCQNNAAQ